MARLIARPAVGINTAVVVIGIAASRPRQTVAFDIVRGVLAATHRLGPTASHTRKSVAFSHDAAEGQRPYASIVRRVAIAGLRKALETKTGAVVNPQRRLGPQIKRIGIAARPIFSVLAAQGF